MDQAIRTSPKRESEFSLIPIGDSVADIDDIDDDNDGIIDITEGMLQSTTSEALAGAATPLVGGSFTPSFGSIDSTVWATGDNLTATFDDVRSFNSPTGSSFEATFYQTSLLFPNHLGKVTLNLGTANVSSTPNAEASNPVVTIRDFDIRDGTFEIQLFDTSGNPVTDLSKIAILFHWPRNVFDTG